MSKSADTTEPSTAREAARLIQHGLDRARAVSTRDRPVDETGLIEAGIADVIADLELQIAVRDDELRHLKAAYEAPGARQRKAEKLERAAILIGAGCSYREAAARLGYKSPSTIHRALKEKEANANRR